MMIEKVLNSVTYIGALIIAVGFVAGFYFMFSENDEQAKIFLSIIPVGFLILFVGVVTNMLRR